MPCRIGGCANTWTWFASQQVRALGQPAPERMCDEHLSQFNDLSDREVPCRTPGCTGAWIWRRGAQLALLQKTGKLRPPPRLCEDCFNAERDTQDAEIRCKIDTCSRAWIWPRDAQLRHRVWVLRQHAKQHAAERAYQVALEEYAASVARAEAEAAEREAAQSHEGDDTTHQAEPHHSDAPSPVTDADAADATDAAATTDSPAVDAPEQRPSAAEPTSDSDSETETESAADSEPDGAEGEGPGRRKRRRRRRRKGAAPMHVHALPRPQPPPRLEIPEGPPARMCGLCSEKVSRLQTRELPCKVHGCTGTWSWDRASQLRAWATLDTDDLAIDPGPPRRMCESCREFVRTHHDRDVACGRPGCEGTWSYKTGAQLQAFLAGRTADPLRLCDECARGGFVPTINPGEELPEGVEQMPCVVPGCAGTWVFFPGQRLSNDVDADGLPVSRMCPEHRRERGLVDPSAEEHAHEDTSVTEDSLDDHGGDAGLIDDADQAPTDAEE
jgi:hypothetical protein